MNDIKSLEERDRAISALVYALAVLDRWDIIFKGGTMLRMCVFLNYRFSEDMDVTYIGNHEYEIPLTVIEICNIAEDIFRGRLVPISTNDDRSWRKYISYGKGRDQLIKFEASSVRSEAEAPPSQIWGLIDRWNHHAIDIGINGFSLQSVMRDKYSCIGRRGEGRDLYDISRIMEEDESAIINGWDLYLDNWSNKDSEWGDRVHPSKLAESMAYLKSELKTTWELSLETKLFEEHKPFEEVFSEVHALIEDLIRQTL